MKAAATQQKGDATMRTTKISKSVIRARREAESNLVGVFSDTRFAANLPRLGEVYDIDLTTGVDRLLEANQEEAEAELAHDREIDAELAALGDELNTLLFDLLSKASA